MSALAHILCLRRAPTSPPPPHYRQGPTSRSMGRGMAVHFYSNGGGFRGFAAKQSMEQVEQIAESASFQDDGMSQVPLRWQGQCQTREEFTNSSSNKKLIGARYYLRGYKAKEHTELPTLFERILRFKSPRDSSGHNSHTASTTAGRHVSNTKYNELGGGEARGGMPIARIVVYKT